MELDNVIARAMLKTMLEELSRLNELSVEVQVLDLRMLEGKPCVSLKILFRKPNRDRYP